MIESKSNYFNALTGVRAIAAYMVFIHHYSPFSEQRFGKLIHNFASELYAGVTVFFVLSGFLITYRYFEIENFSFRKYMVNRIARIYPMYFILTLATFIVFAISQSSSFDFPLFLLNITFLQGFFADFRFSGVMQAWTLTVEEMFYLSAPLFFLLLRRNRFFLIILPVGIFLFGIGLVQLFSRIEYHGFLNSFEFMTDQTFFGRCFEFFVGMGLAVVFKSRINPNKNYYLTYIGLFLMVACIYAMTLVKGDYEYGIMHPIGKVINSFLLPGGIGLFFYGLLTEETFVSKILGSKFFVLIGKSSYVFYLIHIGIIASFIRSFFPNAVILFFAINLISIVIYKFMEEPLNKAIRKY